MAAFPGATARERARVAQAGTPGESAIRLEASRQLRVLFMGPSVTSSPPRLAMEILDQALQVAPVVDQAHRNVRPARGRALQALAALGDALLGLAAGGGVAGAHDALDAGLG